MTVFDSLDRMTREVVRFALLACVGLASCAGTGPVPGPRSLTVLSYNIKRGLGNDGITDITRSAGLIDRLRPDFVALQELDQGVQRSGRVDQMAELGRLTGMHARFADFMPYQGGEYGIGVLSRFPILESRSHPLPPGPEPRVALDVRVQLPDGSQLIFCSVHFYNTEAERLAQARAVIEIYSHEPLPVILSGDFNSTPDDPVMQLVREHWTEAEKGNDAFTFSATEPVEEIDYVLYRPAASFSPTRVQVIDEPLISDHRPVFVELERKATPSHAR